MLSWLPSITYEQVCQAMGLLFLLDLLFYLPIFRVGFSRREAENFRTDDLGFRLVLLGVWLMALALWFAPLPGARLAGAFALTLIFRQYFIAQRWSSVRRGFGAPGFMSHWAARVVLLIELVRAIDAGSTLSLLFATIRWDFGWIMICAGTYKLLVGYLRNNGMEYGRVNPIWGYHWWLFRHVSPHGLIPVVENYLACLVEIAAGVLMVVPSVDAQVLGAVGITLSFAYVGLSIRLGRLAFLMAVLPFFLWPSVQASANAGPVWALGAAVPAAVPTAIRACLWIYIVLLPVVKVTQYVNLFLNRTLPQPLQRWITRYANWVPIIMWRVFTADVTNFYVRILGCDERGDTIEPIVTEASYGIGDWRRWRFKLRLLHVGESIALVSVFTTRKYFPSNVELFNDKLRRYASSLLLDWGRTYPLLRFEYVKVHKAGDHFEYLRLGDYVLDTRTGDVREERLAPGFSFTATADYSPIREGAAPGSMEPKTAR